MSEFNVEFPTLYSRTSTGAINSWTIAALNDGTVRTVWGQMGGSMQEQTYRAEPKNVGRANETTAREQAVLEAESKWKKQKRLKYYESIETANTTVNVKPMTCHVFNEARQKKMRFPATLQPKYNGWRCMGFDKDDRKVRLMTRGKLDYTLPHISEELFGRIPEGYALDGEIYLHGMTLQKIHRLIETPQYLTQKLKFVLYDMVKISGDDEPWEARMSRLQSWAATSAPDCVYLAPNFTVRSVGEINALHNEFVADGFEGAIIRMLQGKYKFAARSTEVLKYKHFDDAEFKMTGWKTGKDGKIVYQCVTEDGKPFDVTPKGDDDEKAEMLKTAGFDVGKMLKVKFLGRSEDNIPIHAVGLGFRSPKDTDSEED